MKNNDMTEMQFPVFDLLPEGRKNAVGSAKLCEQLQYGSIRELQRQIAAERAAGAVILSCSTGGYFKSRDPEEIRSFIMTTERRGRHTLHSTQSAKLYLAKLTGQLYLDE